MMPKSYQYEMRQLRYFLIVAETLHFRKAAELLYITQPGLSRQIKLLENNLGVKLFHRNNRNVELTEAGTYLKGRLTTHLDQLNQIVVTAINIGKGVIGNLRIGYVGSAMQKAIPKLLVDIRNKAPKIIFDLKEMDNQTQIDQLIKGELDIGFIRMNDVPKPLTIVSLIEDTFSLVVPSSHWLNDQNYESLKQVENEKFILFDETYSKSYYATMMNLFESEGVRPNISHKTIHASSIYRLVEKNFGISVVPTSLKEGFDMEVRFIELKNIKQRTALNLVWNSDFIRPVADQVLAIIL